MALLNSYEAHSRRPRAAALRQATAPARAGEAPRKSAQALFPNQTQSKRIKPNQNAFVSPPPRQPPARPRLRAVGRGGRWLGRGEWRRTCVPGSRASRDTTPPRAPLFGFVPADIAGTPFFAALLPHSPTMRVPPPRRHSRSRVIRLPSACLARCGALRRSGGGEI